MEIVKEVVEDTYKDLYVKALDRIDELEKALDKACECIDSMHPCPKEYLDYKCGHKKVCQERKYSTNECWKEWALKDE